jgi:hypothetical protein
MSPLLADGLYVGASQPEAAAVGAGEVWAAPTGGGFSPSDIPDLAVWYDASQQAEAHLDPVGSFTDLSGNARHATQTGTQRPIMRRGDFNGGDCLRFDGSDDYLVHSTGGTDFLTGSGTVLVAAKPIAAGGSDRIVTMTQAGLADTNAASGLIYYASSAIRGFRSSQIGAGHAISTGTAMVAALRGRNGTENDFRVNGTEIGTSTKSAWLADVIALGAGWSASGYTSTETFSGDIAEVLLYARHLTLSELEEAEGYLISRYSIA